MKKRGFLLLLISIYAALLIAGGLFGHGSAWSKSALLSVSLGLLLELLGRLIFKGKRGALEACLLMVGGLTLFFIYRFFVIQKFYPPGMLTLFSLYLAVHLGQALKLQRAQD